MGNAAILVVHDDPEFYDLLQNCAPSGLKLGNAGAGDTAIELIQTTNPAAIIIAQRSGDGRGLEMLRTLRALRPQLPVLFAATPDNPQLILEIFRLGAVDLLELPATSRYLEYALASLQLRLHPPSVVTSFWKKIADYLRPVLPGAVAADSDAPEAQQSSPQKCAAHTPCLTVRLLGPFQVELNGVAVTEWSGHKAKLLFAYLAYHHQRRIYRDMLMETFWPHSTPDSARNCLNVTLHALRTSMQKAAPGHGELLLFKEECYYFPAEVRVELDTERFLRYWSMAQKAEREKDQPEALRFYEAAAALYRGDLLEEFPYEGWMELERENLAETYLVILDKISSYYALDGHPATAISICERILHRDNCREEVYRRLMICYSRTGQREKAIRAYQRCFRTLEETLDVKPTAATDTLYKKICSQQH